MVRVAIIESERGWGQKIDEIREFSTRREAVEFVLDFNRSNEEDYERTGHVPDWYMVARILD